MIFKAMICLSPWPLKRRLLKLFFKYDLSPSAKIGLAWIFPKTLIMEENTKIDHFCVAVHLDAIHMRTNSKIGRSNWITGFPKNLKFDHFIHQVDRKAELHLGESSAITKKHHFDCTNLISIGSFVTIAGYQSQFLTHSINVIENRQDSDPIYIGNYCFVGTNVVVLGGAKLPSYSILGAKSLLNKTFADEWTLYGGVPAKQIQKIPTTAKYFSRKSGFVK